MSEANKALVRRYFEAFDSGGTQAAFQLVSTEVKAHLPGAPNLDHDGLAAFVSAFTVAFPDGHHVLEAQVAEGDLVATRGRYAGTHSGPLQGIPPSSRPVDVTFTAIQQIRDGKIVEEWVDVDVMGIMQQIGAVPAPTAV